MRKDTQAVLLLVVGGTLLKISFGGTYVRYVKTGLFPLLVITGVVLIVVAGFTLWQVIRSGPDAATGPADTGPAEPATADKPTSPDEPTSPAGAPPVPHGSSHRAGAHRAHAGYALHEGHRSVDDDLVSPALAGETMALPVLREVPVLRALPSPREAVEARAEPVVDLTRIEPDPGEVEDEFDHGHDRGRVGWLLLVPALALLLFAPPALGSFQASRNGTALATRAESDFAPLPDGDPARITLLDYASRAVYDRGRSLADRRVLLTGFVIAGPNGEPYLARMVVGCCAADGRPIKVGLTGNVPLDLGPDTWIEAEGTFVQHADRDPVNGELIPYLQVTTVRAIPPPAEQYE
jgi:uncharacterized repeat protein (TIGR03943 family)